jgi:hypothetical protein
MKRMIGAEFKKQLRLNHTLIIIVFSLLIRLVICLIPTAHSSPYSDEVYKKYTSQLEGTLTAEKTEYLNNRFDEICEIISVYDTKQQDYINGKLTFEEYNEYTQSYDIAVAEYSTVEYLCEKAATLNSCNDFKAEIFYDTDYRNFIDGINYDYIMLIAVLCICIPVFDREFSTGSFRQLMTSKRGRTQLCAVKIFTVTLCVFFLSLMMSTVRLGVFSFQHKTDYIEKAVGNILMCDGFGNTAILGYFIKDSLLKALSWVMYSSVICLISVLCRNTSFSFIISFVAMITPLIVSLSSDSRFAGYIFAAGNLKAMYSADIRLTAMTAVLLIKLAVFSGAVVLVWNRKRNSV